MNFEGWSNKPTALVALHFANRQNLYALKQRWLRQVHGYPKKAQRLARLETVLGRWVEGELVLFDPKSSLMSVLLREAQGQINIREIAEEWLETEEIEK